MKNVIKLIKPKTHATFGDAMKHWGKGVSRTFAILAVVFVAMHWLNAGQDNIVNAKPSELPQHEAPQKHIKTVLEIHQKDCWTLKQDPKAELPGAAIVRFTKTGETKYVTNATPRGFKLVDEAFNEALTLAGYADKISQKIDVVALCK